MLSVKGYTGAGRAWKLASVIIDFKPMELNRSPATTTTTPGNPYYYLTKLGKLELIGIPQITYEPLYCSSDNDILVPGIFNSAIKTRDEFEYVPLNATLAETSKQVSFINVPTITIKTMMMKVSQVQQTQ